MKKIKFILAGLSIILAFVALSACDKTSNQSVSSGEQVQQSSENNEADTSSSSDTTESSSEDTYNYPLQSSTFAVTDSDGYKVNVTLSIGKWMKANDSNVNDAWHSLSAKTDGTNMPDGISSLVDGATNGNVQYDSAQSIIVFGTISTSPEDDQSGKDFNGGNGFSWPTIDLGFNLVIDIGEKYGVRQYEPISTNVPSAEGSLTVISGVLDNSGFSQTGGNDKEVDMAYGGNTDGNYTDAFAIIIPKFFTPNNPNGTIQTWLPADGVPDDKGPAINPGQLCIEPTIYGATMAKSTPMSIGQNW